MIALPFLLSYFPLISFSDYPYDSVSRAKKIRLPFFVSELLPFD